ncbi:MAG: DUF1638 domain-containing protein [Halofilum sp. (in: g-proteobacteria)]|nr:DUF1638 domain-containing protein [Halofilum sp. (in: g-proteobacteria)]
MAAAARTLILACGALSHEIIALIRANGWEHMAVQCLPADLHNRPAEIPGAVREKLRAARAHYDHVFVAYADCGTGGRLDDVLAEEGVERLPGAHCYEFYAGAQAFRALAEEEPGTFYLTDFLARHFDRLIIRGMGLDRHPELLSMLFGNYRRVVYLAQRDDADLQARARAAADRLGLEYELRHTGYGELGTALDAVAHEQVVQWRPS